MRIFGWDFKIARAKKEEKAAMMVPHGAWQNSVFGTILESFSGAWQRSVMKESVDVLLTSSPVYACVSLISKDIGKLRWRLMQRDGNIWRESDNPAYSPVLRKPNRYQTRNLFVEYWLLSKCIFGNTYVLKDRDARGVVRALYILDPRGVVPLIAPDGSVFYQTVPDHLAGLPNGEPAIPESEIIHDRHTCLWHPLVGVSPLYAGSGAATQGNRIQASSSKFFENMSRPSGHLTAPGFINDETAKRLKAEFEASFSGTNLGRLLVTGDNLKFEPMSVPAEQAQLIEQQKFTIEDVARAFQVPLYKLGAGTPPSLSSVSALNQEYYQQTLQPHIENIETLMDEALGLANDLTVQFDLEGLLRMDPKSRAETTEIQVRSATITPNEAREGENREPKTGGDQLYMQQQNFSLAALAKRDAKEDPFGTAQPATPPAANDEETDEATAEEAAEAAARQFLENIQKGLDECST